MTSSFHFKIAAFLFVLLFSYSTISSAASDSSDSWGPTSATTRSASAWVSTPSSNQQDPLPEIERLKRKMGDFLNQGLDDSQRKAFAAPQNDPRSDVVEKDGSFYVLMDLPGMKKDQINIEVKGQEVLISGERKVDKEFKTSTLIKVERRYGGFQRVYTIPEEFIADQISAKYENGVLEVRIPKKNAEEVVKPKTIAVS